jgi:hypothetical protein
MSLQPRFPSPMGRESEALDEDATILGRGPAEQHPHTQKDQSANGNGEPRLPGEKARLNEGVCYLGPAVCTLKPTQTSPQTSSSVVPILHIRIFRPWLHLGFLFVSTFFSISNHFISFLLCTFHLRRYFVAIFWRRPQLQAGFPTFPMSRL